MPKKSKDKKGREERDSRQIVRAQAELQRAQEKRTLAVSRGERDVEVARERAAIRLTRATERVEKRTSALARAEARLHESRQADGPAASPAAGSPPSTPEEAAEVLQEAERSAVDQAGPIVTSTQTTVDEEASPNAPQRNWGPSEDR